MSVYNLLNVKYFVTAAMPDGEQMHLEEVAESIAWEENENELSVRLNLTLRDVPYGDGRLSEKLALCTVVYLHADWGEGQQEIFRGTIWEWEHSEVNNDNIILTCYDMLYYLQKSQDSMYFAAGRSTKAIIQDILGNWSVPMGLYSAPDRTHEKLVYKNKTVSAMLTETMSEAEKLTGRKSIVRSNRGRVDIVTRGTNADVYAFTQSSNLISSKDKYSMGELVTRVQIVGSASDDERTKVEATVNGRTEYGILQTVIQMGSGTLEDAKKQAEETLREKGKPTRKITLQAPDFPPIRKGDLIHATLDKLVGYMYVLGVVHNALSRTMQMEVETYE